MPNGEAEVVPSTPPADRVVEPAAGRTPRPSRGGLDAQADAWLIAKVTSGDVDAYEVLVRRHRDRIYRIALRMLGDPHDAEDVAQDVVIQLWTALAGFAGTSAFTTWLYRVVVNRCITVARARKPVQPVVDDDPPPSHGADDVAVARQRARAAMNAVAALPPDLRTVFVLHQIEELGYQEVASILELPEPTVRGRLHRARRTLLRELRSWE
ncbi:RNA polymerase sigma factor [Pseudonocardia oroxyli]|uniref:RNA polymerase, sigma-24 subunit, RpoE n=1 Tax=Pseudonocardia oroxyli TaxID=366584 RepID=A0A1G7PVI3_PSEOR|nr:sigma-70 family RNA polymerase sigma factor [Pseudonocardia oroxyli]SDF90274.1 RNA polymerase, sigma-24 subunit, RpoE [Pseudonocardia oroxyli]